MPDANRSALHLSRGRHVLHRSLPRSWGRLRTSTAVVKVLYIVPGLGRSGGTEQGLASMAPHLVRAGVELEVAVMSDRLALGEVVQAGGGQVHQAESRTRQATYHSLSALTARLQPDLIHTTLFDADMIGRVVGLRRRVPVVTSLVNEAYGSEHYQDPAVRRSRLLGAHMLDAATAESVRRFHAITDSVRRTMAHRLAVRPSKIDVVFRGRDHEVLGRRSPGRRQAVRARLGVRPSAPMVLGVGRHEHQKGLDVLVRAFASVRRELPAAVLVLAGRTGSATAVIDALIDDHGLRESVVVLGPRDDVPDLLAATDAFAMPSCREGFGSVLIEAMALETPTIATDIPPLREVAGPTSWARFVPPDQSELLAHAIIHTLAEPTQRRVLSGAIARRRFLEHFDIERVSAQMYEFYVRALGSGQS